MESVKGRRHGTLSIRIKNDLTVEESYTIKITEQIERSSNRTYKGYMLSSSGKLLAACSHLQQETN